jgi:hypothetical protein
VKRAEGDDGCPGRRGDLDMTYEEACRLLGWTTLPQGFSEQTRKDIIDAAMELSDHGTKPVDPQAANRFRAEVTMFGS